MTPKPLPPLAEVLRARYAYWIDTAREMTRQTGERIRLALARECELLIPELAPYDAELERLRGLLREAHGSLSWLASRADVLTCHADMRDEDLADLRGLLERLQEATS